MTERVMAKPSDQLRGLIKEAQQVKSSKAAKMAAMRQKGVTVTDYGNSVTRARFYKQGVCLGTFEAEIQRSLMRRHGDGPKEHPFVMGGSAYGVMAETSNPFEEQTDHWNWLWWFSGYHQARRDAGYRIEGDVA